MSRIIGGDPAPSGAYPWMAALVEKGRTPANGQVCGGMLVAPQWVLTAAHCVEGESKNTLDIWVRLRDLSATSGGVKRTIKRIYRHPQYGSDRYGNLVNDVALILLDRSVTGVTPIEMASDSSHNQVGELVRVLGWGTTDPVYNTFPDILRQVDFEIVDIADAQADYQNSLGAAHLAAGVPGGGRDSCSGDSGGPLFRIIGGNHILVGVVSFGDGCAEPGVEGIYANVLYFRSWIDGILQLTIQPPDMNVNYRGRLIAHADSSPSFREGTYFGSTRVRGRGKIRRFRVRNSGAGLLFVRKARSAGRIFSFQGGLPSILSPGEGKSLRVKFSPRRRGRVNGKIRIPTNDPSHPAFWFRVQGKGR